MSRLLLLTMCAFALSACGLQRAFYQNPTQHVYQAGAIYLGADLISLINTGKTIEDHVIGLATDADCSTVRASQGGPWCVANPKPVAMIDRATYCYKSLASVSCFTVPLATDAARFDGVRIDQIPAP